MAMLGYSKCKISQELEPYHQMQFSDKLRTDLLDSKAKKIKKMKMKSEKRKDRKKVVG